MIIKTALQKSIYRAFSILPHLGKMLFISVYLDQWLRHCLHVLQRCWNNEYKKKRFCVGFPTLCQGPRNLFLYLFIYLSTREKCLSRGFYLSREDWIPVDVFSLCIVRRPFLFSDFGFWRTCTEFHICFLGIFVSKLRINHFLFSRVLCVL